MHKAPLIRAYFTQNLVEITPNGGGRRDLGER